MPTRGRPQFAARAVEMFRAQTWSNKELVILDDEDSPSFSAPPEGTRYFRAKRTLIGAKRNVCCSRGRGEFIAHWDDDDEYKPERIEAQMKLLLQTSADMVGFNSCEFRTEAGERWECRVMPGYAIGASLLYRRAYWRAHPFRSDIRVGEDGAFCLACARLATIPANGLMVASIHPGNTSPRQTTGPLWRKIA